MGASCSKMVMVSTFDMPGVLVDIAWETFIDIKGGPSFVPHLLAVECLHGDPPAVGSSWKERRIFAGKEVILRKSITRVSRDPETGAFQGLVALNVEGMRWHSQDAAEICSFVVEPLARENWQQSCTATWSMAYIAAGGFFGKILLAIVKPCVLRALNVHLEKEMQCYFEEALRRAVHKREGKAAVTTAESGSEVSLQESK